MIRWAKDILYDLWVEESGSDQGNELLRSWKVKGNLVWDRVWGPGRGGGSFLRSKRGKEEKRKRPSTEHRRGKMGSKATSKIGGGAFLRSRKGNGFLREPEGQGYKQARRRRRDEGSGKGSRRRLLWSHLQRKEQGGDLVTKIGNRYFWADHALEQKRVNFVVALLVQLTIARKS